MRAVFNYATHLPVLCSVSAYPNALYHPGTLSLNFCALSTAKGMELFMNNNCIILLEVKDMPNIKPISDLRNYNEVLRDCQNGDPVFLTKNGRGRYVLVDIQEYERQQSVLSPQKSQSVQKRSGNFLFTEPCFNFINQIHECNDIFFLYIVTYLNRQLFIVEVCS